MDKVLDLVQISGILLTWFVSVSELIYLYKLKFPHLFPPQTDFERWNISIDGLAHNSHSLSGINNF